MPRIVETTVYELNELSGTARERARAWYREGCLDWDWHECIYEDFETVCGLLGLRLHTSPVNLLGGGTREAPRVFFRGFHHQGNGASYEGVYRYAQGASAAIRAHAPRDAELHAIADALADVQRPNFYQLVGDIRQSGSYCHEYTMAIDVERDSPAWQDMTDGAGDAVIEALRDLARWLYRQLEREFCYLTSDEAVDENIEANGFTFTAEGRRFGRSPPPLVPALPRPEFGQPGPGRPADRGGRDPAAACRPSTSSHPTAEERTMTESQAHGAMLVRARIHPRALDHMTRYFDATASSVFVELVQNARRAGADRVDIVTQRTECAAGKETTKVAVWDNGRGIADPAVLLSFGESDWAGGLARRERAAGMGLACLARRGCTVTSRAKAPSPEFATGWRMMLEPDHFLGKTAAVAAPHRMAPEPCGTCVSFHARESLDALRTAASYAARYAPLSVSFNGSELERRDFLKGAVRTELWEGLTLAVIESSCLPNASSDLNFHGLPLNVRLPFVLTLNEAIWTVRAEAVDCPELELVLPARKQAVENAFLDLLRDQARLAIYRTLASMDPPPSVAFGDHARASASGIELPLPPAELCPWVPPSAEADAGDHGSIGRFRPVGPDAIVVEYKADPPSTHPFHRAARRENLAPRLFEADRRLAGYAWYDRLPRLTGVTARVRVGGAACTLEALQRRLRKARDNGAPFDPQVRAESIVYTVEIARPDGALFTCPYPADVVFLDASSGWLSDAEPVIAADSDIDAEDLARLLRLAYFVPCRDIDADSYDTQSDRFDDEAMHMALQHVASPDEATREAIARAVLQDIHWMFPRGRDVDILVRGEHVLVKLGALSSA